VTIIVIRHYDFVISFPHKMRSTPACHPATRPLAGPLRDDPRGDSSLTFDPMKTPSSKSPFSIPSHRLLSAISLAAMLALCLPAAALVPQLDPASIALTQSPPAVQKTIQENVGNGKVTAMSKSEEDGLIRYEVDFTKGGVSRDLKVAEDGTLVSIQAALAETPPAVQKAIQAQLGESKLGDIEKTFEGAEISYEVEITTKDGRESQFTLSDAGVLLEIEIALNEAPAPVQKTVTEQMGGGSLTTLTKIIDERVTYEANFTKDGKEGAVTVGPNGALLTLQITIEQVPPGALKTIHEKVGNGKILSVWQSYEKREKVLPIKVESVKDGKAFNFSVGPKGHFLGMDD
jgi:uncharacterized membrane protein YkoI